MTLLTLFNRGDNDFLFYYFGTLLCLAFNLCAVECIISPAANPFLSLNKRVPINHSFQRLRRKRPLLLRTLVCFRKDYYSCVMP